MAGNNCCSERASKVLSYLKLIYPSIYAKPNGDGFDAYINAESSNALCHISGDGSITSSQCDAIKRKINSYAEELKKEIAMAENSANEANQLLIGLEQLHVEDSNWPIAKMLARNCRAGINELAKAMHMHSSSVENYISFLNKRYGLKYTIELNLEEAGFLPVVIFGKFLGEKPSIDEMERAFLNLNDSGIQFAASLHGKYDFIIFYIAPYADAYAWEDSLHALKKALFANYSIDWVFSPAFKDYGLLPLRDSWFSVLERTAWKKSRAHMRPYPGQLTYSKYLVLKELFANARESFSEMDSRLGKQHGESYAIARELAYRRLISRFTLHFAINPKSIAVFLSYSNASQLSGLGLPYAYIGKVYSPVCEIAFIPLMHDGAMEQVLNAIHSIDPNAIAMETEHVFIDGMRYGIQSFST